MVKIDPIKKEIIFDQLFLYDEYKTFDKIAENQNVEEKEIRELNREFCITRGEEIARIRKIRTIFDNKMGNKKIKENNLWDFKSFKMFYVWFIETYEKQGGKCCYCGTSESIIKQIAEKRSNYYPQRGQSLEVERKESGKGKNKYNEGNCALCCFFCNNAKSDVFDEAEFIHIKEGIGKAIEIIRKKENIK